LIVYSILRFSAVGSMLCSPNQKSKKQFWTTSYLPRCWRIRYHPVRISMWIIGYYYRYYEQVFYAHHIPNFHAHIVIYYRYSSRHAEWTTISKNDCVIFFFFSIYPSPSKPTSEKLYFTFFSRGYRNAFPSDIKCSCIQISPCAHYVRWSGCWHIWSEEQIITAYPMSGHRSLKFTSENAW